MKLPILPTATILLMSLISANSAIAQSVRITCIRTQNQINCPGYGIFNYRYSSINSNYNTQDLDQAINRIYQQYLGRNADSAGLVAYRNSIINGGSIENVRNAIANSSEARNRNGNNTNYNTQDIDRAINNIYQRYLGRNADPAGLVAYRNSIINGGSIENVRNAIANSSEARSRNGNNSNNNIQNIDRAINNIYQQYLGRDADPAGLVAYRNSILNGGSIEDVRNAIANSPEARNRNGNSTFNRKDNKKDKDDRNEVSNRSEGRNRNGNSGFDREDNKKEK